MARGETSSTDNTWLDVPPTARQTWWAIAVTAVVLAGFTAVIPVATHPLGELNAFFPSLDAIVFVSDLVTAVLLYAQFAVSRSRAMLALATGYLFTALIVIPHALTFAGAFSPAGLLGANIQTGSWLFIFWQIGFAAALLAFHPPSSRRARSIPRRRRCRPSRRRFRRSRRRCRPSRR